jgi:hypothetical protein
MREGLSTKSEFVIFNIIVDDGSETIALYNYFPNAKIYAFEGDLTMVPICSANLAPFADRVTFTPTATTNYDGSMIINGNEVACARLDTFIVNNDIKRVDFILINHKTGVLPALQGLGEHLQYVQYLYSLITYYEVFTGQVIDCNDFLLEQNFRNMDVLSDNDWSDNAMYCNNRQDVVSYVGGKTDAHISAFVNSTLVNVVGLHFLYLIVPDSSFSDISALVASSSSGIKCVLVKESVFPFSLQTIESYNTTGSAALNIFLFKQLLHLYAYKIIPGLTGRHMVLDAETFFVVPTTFTDSKVNLYSFVNGYNADVFTHMHNMHPFFRCIDDTKSGECGHMIFETRHMFTVVGLVELLNNQDFYSVFLSRVQSFSSKTTSEYELFFNFLPLSGFSNFQYRSLPWRSGVLADVATTTDVNYLVIN